MPKAKNLNIVKPFKNIQCTSLGPPGEAQDHPQWRMVSYLPQRREDRLQGTQIPSVTQIRHYHVARSVTNFFLQLYQLPSLLSELIPMHLSNGTKCCSPLNSCQEGCIILYLHPPHQPMESQIVALPVCLCVLGKGDIDLRTPPPRPTLLCSYLMISGLSIAYTSPQWRQAEL